MRTRNYPVFSILQIIFLALIASKLSVSNCYSQPTIQWQKCLGGSLDELVASTRQTTDGGYIVSGWSKSNDGNVSGNHGDSDMWIIKLDPTGNIQWQKSLGGTLEEHAYDIRQTSDGGYIVAGRSYSNDGDVSGNNGIANFWIVKLDPFGNIQWQKCLGGSSVETALSIQQTIDGGYIVAGEAASNDGDVSGSHGGIYDMWVVKLNSIGNIEWQKCFGGTGIDFEAKVLQINSQSYILLGHTFSNNGNISGNHGSDDYWVAKLDSIGNIIWQKCLGGTGNDYPKTIQLTHDNGFILCGQSNSTDGDVSGNHGDYDYWIVKLDSVGNIQWQRSLGGTGDDEAYSIYQTNDNGYVIAGFSSSTNGDVIGNHGGWENWVVKLDSTGSIQWQKCLGGTGNEYGFDISQTSDGGYITSGDTRSNNGDVSGNHGGNDLWVVKLNPVGLPMSTPIFNLSASLNERVIHLAWSAYSGLNNSYFDLEKSVDRMNWSQISRIEGCVSCSDERYYYFDDGNITSGISYYRLKQIDGDGTPHYSNIVSLEVPIRDPVIKTIGEYWVFSDLVDGSQIEIYSMQGVPLLKTYSDGKELRLNAQNYPTGYYVVYIAFNSHSTVKKIMR